MFERYAENARRTIQFAESVAAELGSSEISTEHVLLGLLTDEILMKGVMAGISAQEIRDSIRDREVGESPPPESPSPKMPLSEESKKALVLARREAQALARRYVNNFHILLGLTQIETCLAARALKRAGVLAGAVREQISALQEDGEEGNASRMPTGAGADTSDSDRDLEDLELLALELAQLEDYPGVLELADTAMAEDAATTEEGSNRYFTTRMLTRLASVIATTMGDLGLAQRYYEFRVDRDPSEVNALYGLACCLQEQGKSEYANKIARKSYSASVARGDEMGNDLADMIMRRFPEIEFAGPRDISGQG